MEQVFAIIKNLNFFPCTDQTSKVEKQHDFSMILLISQFSRKKCKQCHYWQKHRNDNGTNGDQ